MDDCFQTSLRSVSPSWAGPTSHTMHCLSDLDSGMEPGDSGQFARRPTSLPRCTSCISKLGAQLARSSTMTTTPGNIMSPVWTMENIMEKRSDSDRASIYSRSSGSASEYSVPRTTCLLDKSFESKRSSPVACCSPAIPAKTVSPCQCWQQKQCCCKKKTFSGPYENYDVPKTPMPLIQEHPIDPANNKDASTLYDTPKKLKCLINGQSCNCSLNTEDLKVEETAEPARAGGGGGGRDGDAEHSNYVNITPVCADAPAPRVDYGNYANVDLNATLEKFESSIQILKSAGFSQEEIEALEDIPEHDDDVSTTTANTVHPLTECCNDHLNYMHMEPLDVGGSGNRNYSDDVSGISHVSDPAQRSDADRAASARRSSSADFTKRPEDADYGTGKNVCFTPTVMRKACRSDDTPPAQRKRNGADGDRVAKMAEGAAKSENSFVARFRDSVKIRRSSSVPSKSDKNRDSSSSNDSGVSTGSLKHHKCDFNEFEMPVTNSKSCKKHIKCKNQSRKALTPSHTPVFVKSNSSDPLKNITFQFDEVATLTKSNSCDVDTLTRRKKKAPEAECAARHSQLTAKSTSSGASDTSDYMESLSVSSLSSCDVTAERHAARPRSGREYGTRALLSGVCHVDG
ncbi:hypothetical protein EVAR_45466_1 [Eumeta japonica]|uniref:Uncharacterized protein n=1 Tax=Eumeta variegata TaxID=151549 RepID=A0A4C1WED3_EUMVA|nr:hypothetical protein EVAR_45466_1 [Eumeta japonica]